MATVENGFGICVLSQLPSVQWRLASRWNGSTGLPVALASHTAPGCATPAGPRGPSTVNPAGFPAKHFNDYELTYGMGGGTEIGVSAAGAREFGLRFAPQNPHPRDTEYFFGGYLQKRIDRVHGSAVEELEKAPFGPERARLRKISLAIDRGQGVAARLGRVCLLGGRKKLLR